LPNKFTDKIAKSESNGQSIARVQPDDGTYSHEQNSIFASLYEIRISCPEWESAAIFSDHAFGLFEVVDDID
jgi:hypothetical protein